MDILDLGSPYFGQTERVLMHKYVLGQRRENDPKELFYDFDTIQVLGATKEGNATVIHLRMHDIHCWDGIYSFHFTQEWDEGIRDTELTLTQVLVYEWSTQSNATRTRETLLAGELSKAEYELLEIETQIHKLEMRKRELQEQWQ
jgi:hypothetical protein